MATDDETDESADGPGSVPTVDRKGKKKIPPWRDIIPDNIGELMADPMAVAAVLPMRALTIALVQVSNAVGMKPKERARLIVQLVTAMKGARDPARVWEAEAAIRGDVESLQQTSAGPVAEENPLKHAAGSEADTATSRATPLRGRPRKRALL